MDNALDRMGTQGADFCRRQKISMRKRLGQLARRSKRLSWTESAIGPNGRVDAFLGFSGGSNGSETKVYKMHVRILLAKYRTYVPCVACGGTRFKPESLLTSFRERLSPNFTNSRSKDLRDRLLTYAAPSSESEIAEPILREIRSRLDYLHQVGLGYLTLDRQSRTLSGEVQRVNLTTALGAALVNTLYVLDEPSTGLHARDGAC